MSPAELLAIYSEETVAVRRAVVRDTPETRRELAAFGAWCESRHVDPRAWIRARQAAVGAAAEARGGRAPLIKVKHLARDEFLERFEDWQGDKAHESIGQERMVRNTVRDDGRRGPELHPHAEAVKRAMSRAGSWMSCRVAAPTLTLGWNPRSSHCAVCPEARPCADALPHEVRLARS